MQVKNFGKELILLYFRENATKNMRVLLLHSRIQTPVSLDKEVDEDITPAEHVQ